MGLGRRGRWYVWGEGWGWEGEDDVTYGGKGEVGKERTMVCMEGKGGVERRGQWYVRGRVGLRRRGRWYVGGEGWGSEGEEDGTYGGKDGVGKERTMVRMGGGWGWEGEDDGTYGGRVVLQRRGRWYVREKDEELGRRVSIRPT